MGPAEPAMGRGRDVTTDRKALTREERDAAYACYEVFELDVATRRYGAKDFVAMAENAASLLRRALRDLDAKDARIEELEAENRRRNILIHDIATENEALRKWNLAGKPAFLREVDTTSQKERDSARNWSAAWKAAAKENRRLSDVHAIERDTVADELDNVTANYALLATDSIDVDGKMAERMAKLEAVAEAAGVLKDLKDVLESDPDLSDITQYTNEIYEACAALRALDTEALSALEEGE